MYFPPQILQLDISCTLNFKLTGFPEEFTQSYRGGLGQREDAKEVWPLVVLAKKSRQHYQTGNVNKVNGGGVIISNISTLRLVCRAASL